MGAGESEKGRGRGIVLAAPHLACSTSLWLKPLRLMGSACMNVLQNQVRKACPEKK